ncbi:MAG: hypothetical protein KJ737_09520 [Proteobacteria bacterium]|nr:hypothetical protein [Pseudomonadota bacterium]
MKSNARIFRYGLGVAVAWGLFISLTACGGSSGSSGSGADLIDGGDTINGSLRVRVVTSKDFIDGLPDATVVLSYPDGSLAATGVTSDVGEVTFSNPPQHATVTAVYRFPVYGDKTGYSLTSYYDVNVSAITFDIDDFQNPNETIGSGVVNISNQVGADDWRLVGVDHYSYSGGDMSTMNFALNEDSIQENGMFSIGVVGYDVDDNPVGYGFLQDQAFVDGMVLDIPLDRTDFGILTYTLKNVPETAKVLHYGCGPRNTGDPSSEFGIGEKPVLAPFPVSVSCHYLPDVGDNFLSVTSLDFDQNEDDINESSVSLFVFGAQGDQTFDFDDALGVPSNISLEFDGTQAMAVSWAGDSTGADSIRIRIDLDDTSDYIFKYDICIPPSRNSIILPHLPDSLGDFTSTVNRCSVNFNNSSYFSGYNDLLTKMEQFYRGTYTVPLDFIQTVSSSYLTIGDM